jgi:hypothetical protein
MAALPWYTNATRPLVGGHGLGRRVSKSRPFPRLLRAPDVPTFTVNQRLVIPYQYIPKYDQGQEGACVGFAWSWAMSMLNRRFYAARKLYLEAQLRDPWAETPPEEGTSITAGALVLQQQGHWRFARGITFPLALFEGIASFKMATTVDDLRWAIANHVPAVLGIDWYQSFDRPEWVDVGMGGPRWWIGRGTLGAVRGGHAICCCGARDDLDAFVLINSWGYDYPRTVQIPYATVHRLLNESGEALIPMDRP